MVSAAVIPLAAEEHPMERAVTAEPAVTVAGALMAVSVVMLETVVMEDRSTTAVDTMADAITTPHAITAEVPVLASLSHQAMDTLHRPAILRAFMTKAATGTIIPVVSLLLHTVTKRSFAEGALGKTGAPLPM